MQDTYFTLDAGNFDEGHRGFVIRQHNNSHSFAYNADDNFLRPTTCIKDEPNTNLDGPTTIALQPQRQH
jgi:hypothetical protein